MTKLQQCSCQNRTRRRKLFVSLFLLRRDKEGRHQTNPTIPTGGQQTKDSGFLSLEHYIGTKTKLKLSENFPQEGPTDCLFNCVPGAFLASLGEQMLSTSSFSVEELTCPVCRDIFKHPVILSCSHSLCKACLQEWWRNKPQECPVCRSIDSCCRPPRNLALKNLCESIVLETVHSVAAGWENLCSLHSEKFKLFCLDHQQPVCLVCRDSKRHTDHRFKHIYEAAQDHRKELQRSLKIMKWKVKLFNQVKEPCNQTEEQSTVQAPHTEMQMQKEIMRLPQVLQEQGEARIAALMEEEEQKSRMIKKKSVGPSKAAEALSSRIRAIEEVLRADDVLMLQNYKNTVELVRRPLPDDPELVSGAQTDVAKELGNLINIWDKTIVLHSF